MSEAQYDPVFYIDHNRYTENVNLFRAYKAIPGDPVKAFRRQCVPGGRWEPLAHNVLRALVNAQMVVVTTEAHINHTSTIYSTLPKDDVKPAAKFWTRGIGGDAVYHLARDQSLWFADPRTGEWRHSTAVSTLAMHGMISRRDVVETVNPLPNKALPFIVNGASLLESVKEAGTTINVMSLTINQ